MDRISFHGPVWGTEVSESPLIIIKGGRRPAALEMADIKTENCVRRCELENPAIPRKKREKKKIQTSLKKKTSLLQKKYAKLMYSELNYSHQTLHGISSPSLLRVSLIHRRNFVTL